MRLLAASSITFTDLSDASGAMLTSDVLLVPCDSMGVPTLALGSSPLTSRMIILQGGIEQSGWSFSRTTQQGVTASVDSSGVVSVTAISADNGFVEITASKSGHTPLIKKLTVSKVYQGETGSLASDFSIELSPAAFQISSRGMVMEAQVITATCRKTNIVGSPAITWTSEGVQLSTATGETVIIAINISMMITSFTLSCTVEGYGTKSLEVQGIRSGSPRPLYLGLLASAPSDTPEGPLLYNPGLGGDYYLGTDMIPYWYDGASFTSEGLSYVPNYADIMSHAAAEALKVPNTIPVTSALYAYFDHMSVTNAYIDGLRTRTLKLAGGGSIQSEQYIENQLGFLLKADGTFNAVNANLINAIISGSGTFKGIIDSPPLKTTTQSEAAPPVTFNSKTHWSQSQLDSWLASTKGFAQNTLYSLSGSFNGVGFDRVIRSSGGAYVQHHSMSGAGQDLLKTNTDESYCIGIERSVTIEVSGYYQVNFTAPRDTWYEEMPLYCPMTVYRNGTPLCMNGPSKYWSYQIGHDYSFTSWLANTSFSQTYSHYYSFNRGDVIKYFAPYKVISVGSSTTREGRYTNGTPKVTLGLLISDAGLLLRQNYLYTRLTPAAYYSKAISISGFTPLINYAKAIAFVGGMSNYPTNELKTASGTLVYNGQSYQVIGVMKTSATSMTVFHKNGSINFSLPDADPGFSGYYNASGSYSVIASVAGAEMMNINARETDTYSIGNTHRFLNVIGKNVIGDILETPNMKSYQYLGVGDDLNNVFKAGFYVMRPEVANNPYGWCGMLVIPSHTVHQILVQHAATTIYIRAHNVNNNTWGAWRAI